MEEKLVKIEVRVRTLTNADGLSFLVYKGFTKKGWQDLRFTKDVAEETRPTKNCYLYVEKENVSVDNKKRFPVVWVRKIEKVEVIELSQKIDDYFDC